MTNEKRLINEIFIMRAVACMAVVLLHSISSYLRINDHAHIQILQLFLMFGTPTFVFISELLLSHSYKGIKPKGFFRKRFQFIMIPYLVMSMFYAWVELWDVKEFSFSVFTIESLKNIFIGDYHGYFILIIFQFYILHFVYQKYIADKIKPFLAILLALVLNVGYLAIFNVSRILIDADGYLQTFMNDDFKLLFIAWIFYFVVAFYCGQNFDAVRGFIKKNSIYIVGLLIASVTFILLNYYVLGFGSIHSKRFDIPIYTISMIGLMILVFSKVNKIPSTIMLISKYSFGIYLLHQFYFRLFEQINLLPISNSLIYISVSFVLSIAFSIMTTYLLNKIPFGEFVVGKVKSVKSLKESKSNSKTQTSQ